MGGRTVRPTGRYLICDLYQGLKPLATIARPPGEIQALSKTCLITSDK